MIKRPYAVVSRRTRPADDGGTVALPDPTARKPITAQARKTITDVVRLLAAVVHRLRTPLLVVLLAPLVPGVALVVVSTARGGADVPWAVTFLVIGLIPSAWLAVRRRQLLRALEPPAEAAAQIYSLFSVPAVWEQVKSNLGTVAVGTGKLRLRTLGGKIWRGVKLGALLKSGVQDSPRLAPFLPGRLRGLAFLLAWCLASFAALTVLAVLEGFVASLGIG